MFALEVIKEVYFSKNQNYSHFYQPWAQYICLQYIANVAGISIAELLSATVLFSGLAVLTRLEYQQVKAVRSLNSAYISREKS